jgi:hypothetical protein
MVSQRGTARICVAALEWHHFARSGILCHAPAYGMHRQTGVAVLQPYVLPCHVCEKGARRVRAFDDDQGQCRARSSPSYVVDDDPERAVGHGGACRTRTGGGFRVWRNPCCRTTAAVTEPGSCEAKGSLFELETVVLHARNGRGTARNQRGMLFRRRHEECDGRFRRDVSGEEVLGVVPTLKSSCRPIVAVAGWAGVPMLK